MRGKILLSFFLLILVNAAVKAQRTADIGFAPGVVTYVGDLGNEKWYPFSSYNAGMQITLRNFLNNSDKTHSKNTAFDLELRMSWHRLQYDETKSLGGKSGSDLRNYLRGLNFRNDLFGTMVNFTYTHYKNRFQPLYRQKFCYYFLAGIGVFYGEPKADLFRGGVNPGNRYYYWTDGTIHTVDQYSKRQGEIIEKDGIYETNLRDWKTEGEASNAEGRHAKAYRNVNVGFPTGFGVRYGLNKDLTISAEFDYYFFLTDYLDDASGRYATYDELKSSFPDATQYEIAKYISDPTGRGTNGTISHATSPRGNPKMKDTFTFFGIEVAYNFTWKEKGIFGQLARN
jgi:hypothetical protein